MKYKFLSAVVALSCALSSALFAQEDVESSAGGGSNYNLDAQVGLYYTQGYGNYIHDSEGLGERKMDFSNAFAYVGFEGLEFDHLRFGANLLGSVKLSAGKTANGSSYESLGMGANAILYQAYVGFVSDYFHISAGREELDMEWINDYVEGARLGGSIANTDINFYYFDRQAVADPNEILPFEDNRIGHTFVASISNQSLEHLLFSAYFMSLDKRLWNLEATPFNAAGLGVTFSFGEEITSDTTLKYTFFDSKDIIASDTHYLQVEEAIAWNGLGINLGIIKIFDNADLDSISINVLGDQNPFEQGDQVYAKNALTAYIGVSYAYDDWFNVAILYGNTSGIQNANAKETINELNIGAGFTWSGLELGLIYSKVFGNSVESFVYGSQRGDKKLNRDYFEAMIAYNF